MTKKYNGGKGNAGLRLCCGLKFNYMQQMNQISNDVLLTWQEMKNIFEIQNIRGEGQCQRPLLRGCDKSSKKGSCTIMVLYYRFNGQKIFWYWLYGKDIVYGTRHTCLFSTIIIMRKTGSICFRNAHNHL